MQEHPAVDDTTETPELEPQVDATPTEDLAATAADKTADAPENEAEIQFANTVANSTESAAQGAIVPLPGLHRQEQPKTSFWKRIRLSRRGLSPATEDDRMIARLDGIASRIENCERGLGERIRQLDERFSEVWEVEEQLSRLVELREMLEDIQERQGRIDGRTRSFERRLSLVVALASISAVAALAVALSAVL